jgi:hypothetical protein
VRLLPWFFIEEQVTRSSGCPWCDIDYKREHPCAKEKR